MQPVTLPTWIVSDGHAGNHRQVEALAQVLGCTQARHFIVQPNAAARLLAPRMFPAAHWALGDAFAEALRTPPKLVIGCGRQGALASRLARKHGACAVQILNPRICPKHWDALIVPAHDRIHGDNIITVQGSLNAIDDAWLLRARQQFAQLLALPSPRIAVLVGGPSAHLRDEEAVLAGFRSLAQLLRDYGGSLLCTVSRRTPKAWIATLSQVRAAVPGLFWRGEDDGPNPYAGLLGCADGIVCTPDSVNMLSEAAATTAPLWIIAPHAITGRPSQFIRYLLESGRALEFFGNGKNWMHPQLLQQPLTPLRETARAAQRLQALLPLPLH